MNVYVLCSVNCCVCVQAIAECIVNISIGALRPTAHNMNFPHPFDSSQLH